MYNARTYTARDRSIHWHNVVCQSGVVKSCQRGLARDGKQTPACALEMSSPETRVQMEAPPETTAETPAVSSVLGHFNFQYSIFYFLFTLEIEKRTARSSF